jgi:hypothetical protein
MKGILSKPLILFVKRLILIAIKSRISVKELIRIKDDRLLFKIKKQLSMEMSALL